MTTSRSNSGGFTLVEVMVAIVIMLVGVVGLLQSLNVAMEYNLKNQLRDEAVYVGEKYMNFQRGKSFDLLSTAYGRRYEPSKIRGRNSSYSVDMTVEKLSEDATTPSKQLDVTVSWTYKGVVFQNRVSTTISTIK